MMRFDDLDVAAGEMRQRVNLQQLTETPDDYGQMVKSFATVYTCWASIRPASGRGLVNSEQLKSVVSHAIVMRYNPDLTFDPTYRITYGSRVFNIESIVNIAERGKKLVALCSEQVAPRLS